MFLPWCNQWSSQKNSNSGVIFVHGPDPRTANDADLKKNILLFVTLILEIES